MEKTYIKGFNHGYIIAKFMQPLFSKLSTPISKLGEYGQGFQDGGKEIQKEREVKLLNEFRELRETDKDKDLDIER